MNGLERARINTRKDGPMRFTSAIVVGAIFGALVLVGAAPADARAKLETSLRPGSVGPTLQVRPTSGPAGASIRIRGSGFVYHSCSIVITFVDADGVATILKAIFPATESFHGNARIPSGAAPGRGTIQAVQYNSRVGRCDSVLLQTSATFTVTP